MATEEHLAAADFVKTTHEKLRFNARKHGEEKAWEQHCNDRENLNKYAKAMHHLASNFWEKNCKDKTRVNWIHDYTQDYYFKSEMLKFRRKEQEIGEKMRLRFEQLSLIVVKEQIRVLDVGSCYNPFQKFHTFNVLPIDLAPATQDVYKCDFLNVNVSNETKIHNSEILALKANSFDVVIFSLFLEYLPSPSQRLSSCKKAYNLLNWEGILFIITPDSKHVGANAKIMKTWRFILGKLGFLRIKYEKLKHLHCMVFRKSIDPKIVHRWVLLQDQSHFYKEFVIPQDFKKLEEPLHTNNNVNPEVVEIKWEELPFFTNK